jgi:hypothetical protein
MIQDTDERCIIAIPRTIASPEHRTGNSVERVVSIGEYITDRRGNVLQVERKQAVKSR